MRPLNERGKQAAAEMSVFFAQTFEKPQLFLSSPAVRAISTARVFAEAFGVSEADIQQDEDIYDAETWTVMQIIRNIPNDVNSVILFGHNPSFTDVANNFASKIILNVPTCGIIVIDVNTESWSNINNLNSTVVEQFFPKQHLQ